MKPSKHRAAVADAAERGLTAAQTAAELGVSHWVVRAAARRAGVKLAKAINVDAQRASMTRCRARRVYLWGATQVRRLLAQRGAAEQILAAGGCWVELERDLKLNRVTLRRLRDMTGELYRANAEIIDRVLAAPDGRTRGRTPVRGQPDTGRVA